MNDLLLPHLLDLLVEPDAEGMVLAGGFGLYLKHQFSLNQDRPILIAEPPPSRTTQDMDFFLSMSFFASDRASAFKSVLDRLGYEVMNDAKHFHFRKLVERPGLFPLEIRVDLLARSPRTGEDVRSDTRRVRAPGGIHLHGRHTPEAFSVEARTLEIPLLGNKSDGEQVSTRVMVPHSYSWLFMKVRAAHDWLLRKERGDEDKAGSEKHLQDIYTLVALLTEAEFAEADEMNREFQEIDLVEQIRGGCRALFAQDDSPGWLQLIELNGGPLHAGFRPALARMLGLAGWV